ncbi:MAG TPA: hypothetical protein VGW78_07660 [Candidatus Babeliales bacterium]|jgi:hypothetical protein|nr:hypothetical protein [Candidatus Babeliales bacterium]
MNIETVLYLINVFGTMKDVVCIASMISVFALGVCAFIFGIIKASGDGDSLWIAYSIFLKKHFWKFIFLVFLACIIPSEKTMYFMLGAHAIKSSPLPSKIELAIEKKIDDFLSEDEKKSEK